MEKKIKKAFHPIPRTPVDPEGGTIQRQPKPISRATIAGVSACVKTRLAHNLAQGMRRSAALLEALKHCKGSSTVRR